MLKKFFLNLLSSFVGAWIAIGLFVLVGILVCIGLVSRISFSTDAPKVVKHSILKIELEGEIEETETARNIDIPSLVQGNVDKPQTLNVLVKAIEEAAVNKNIDAIYIECNGVSASPATLHALRAALEEFKTEAPTKKIIAYGPSLSQGDYYVSTVADSLFVNPQGEVSLRGLTSIVPYFKDLLDKVGVSFQVAKVGKFKSAVEPYLYNEMSEPARAQLDTLNGVMWNFIKGEIATSRKIKPELIDTLINRDMLMFRTPKFAESKKLVDGIRYERHVMNSLANIIGKEVKDLNFVDAQTLVGQTNWMADNKAKKQIAVLYATGEIAENAKAGIDCYKLVPVILDLAEDDNIKGMVLRVNSPGGSVFGSEQIAEALAYFQSQGKPLAVSMGDYAASGGYWISCHADVIYADPLTITGSIGIFGLMPNASELAKKLGVNFETVTTNPNGVQALPFKPFNETQMAALQQTIEQGYDEFVNRVATGRKMKDSKVREIAEGRVWNAITAQKLGLVDSLGNVQKAIEWVADKADLGESYAIGAYPEFEQSIWDFIPTAGGVDLMAMLEEALNQKDATKTVLVLQPLFSRKPVQARMMDIRFSL